MKSIMIVGLILIVAGIFALASPSISYTKREKIIDIGPIEATTERKKTIPIRPWLGGAALVCGLVLVVAGSKKG